MARSGTLFTRESAAGSLVSHPVLVFCLTFPVYMVQGLLLQFGPSTHGTDQRHEINVPILEWLSTQSLGANADSKVHGCN